MQPAEPLPGDFLAAVLKARPELLNDWVAKLWSRFFCLSVYITMYLNDNQRSEFYESIGLNTRQVSKGAPGSGWRGRYARGSCARGGVVGALCACLHTQTHARAHASAHTAPLPPYPTRSSTSTSSSRPTRAPSGCSRRCPTWSRPLSLSAWTASWSSTPRCARVCGLVGGCARVFCACVLLARELRASVWVGVRVVLRWGTRLAFGRVWQE